MKFIKVDTGNRLILDGFAALWYKILKLTPAWAVVICKEMAWPAGMVASALSTPDHVKAPVPAL